MSDRIAFFIQVIIPVWGTTGALCLGWVIGGV